MQINVRNDAMSSASELDDRSIAIPALQGAALYRLIALLFVVQIIDGIDMNALAFVGSGVMQEFNIGKSMFGACIGVAFIGMAGGAVLFGWLGDRLGKRFCVLLIVTLFGMGSLATAFSPNAETLLILRLLSGAALGGFLPVATSLVVERSPTKVRTTAVTAMTIGSAGGAAVCGVIASLIVPHFGWRSLFVVGWILPMILLPILFIYLPRDVVASKRDATAALTMVRPSLFRRGAWRITLPCWGMFFFGAMPVFFIMGWLPTLAKESGESVAQAALATSVCSIMGAVGGICLAKLADRFGYKVMPVVTVAGAVSAVLLGMAIGGGAFLLASAVAGFLIVGMLTTLGAVAGQFYATSIRGFGLGSAMGLMRIGAALSPWLAGLALDMGVSSKALFWIGGGLVLVSGFLLQVMARNPMVDDGQIPG
jgi:AAHS family 4-hydroxybenzoate transporter-like MFS transporter